MKKSVYFSVAGKLDDDDDENGDYNDREQLNGGTPNSSTTITEILPLPTEERHSKFCIFVRTCVTILALAIPLAISRLSWTAMKTTDTALIGHTGTEYLSASAVADLYTQSTGVFINGGVLSTLVSQAYGSTNKKMGGIWLQVSLVVLGALSLPVILSYLLCGPALVFMGVNEDLIRFAAYYAFILVIAIPPRIVIGQISQYLMAQGMANPLVKTGLFSMVVNLILGVIMVFGLGIPGFSGYGFWACPVVTVVVEWVTLFIYVYWYCYKQRLHEKGGCWPEDNFQWAYITSERVREYSSLYFPAAIASASDWWRVSAIGVVAVSFHDDASLAVFNSAYRITWMSLIVIGSIGSAMGVLLGQELGKGDYGKAKYVTHTCLGMALGMVLVLGAIFYSIPEKVALIFSGDQAVIELYRNVALPLTTMLIAMNLSVLLERVPLSCGRSKMVHHCQK